MHPADVADYVGDAVATLIAHLADAPDLRAGVPQLENDVHCYIPITVSERATVEHAVPSNLVLPGGIGIQTVFRVPDLAASSKRDRELVLHLDLTGYDADPPTAELLLPDRAPLPPEQWPKSTDGQGIVASHPDYPRPFFCRRGLREYHSHPQHEDDPWDRHREELPLYAVVREVLHDLQTRLVLR
jgi:hypothetical protein